MRPVCAHDGQGEILTRRVLDHGGGSALNFVDMTILPPGTTVGLHTHQMDEEEHYAILSGRGQMSLDGQLIEVGPGDLIVNRPGGRHGLTNVGSEPLRMLVYEVRVPDKK